MSEFDDNPFADPFGEPSIKEATQPNSAATNNTLADYDPFSVHPNSVSTGTTNAAQPAMVTPSVATPAAPPPYTQTGQQNVSATEFQRRQEELERKAEELARREEQLKAASQGVPGARRDNWPPLPEGCPVGPCFYQDINVDIPSDFQKIVRLIYYMWMFHVLMLLINVLGTLALYVSLNDGQSFGLSILYLLLFSPLSYLCWFRPIYKAFRSDSSFNFMVFFCVFFFQMMFLIAQAVGIPNMGAVGWVGVGKAFNSGHIGAGVFLVLVALCGSAIAAASAGILIWVHRIYRNTGASFVKAQAEFAQGVMRNEHVQNVTANAAAAAARSHFTTGSTTGYNTASTAGARSPSDASTASSAGGPRF